MRGGGYKPHTLRVIEDPITKQRENVTPEPLERIELKDNRNWRTVISAMEDVTHSPSGTANRIGRDAPYRIASKTGTAQVASLRQDEAKAPTLEQTPVHLRDHALFIAFAPVDEPRIAIAVIAEHAGGGSAVAAPIARKVMDQALLGEVLFTGEPAFVPPPPPAGVRR
jgi:penicillin-binding protein 2